MHMDALWKDNERLKTDSKLLIAKCGNQKASVVANKQAVITCVKEQT